MSIMNFNTANQTFRQIMGNGLLYRVPPFQRDYSWGEDEWEDLWQDMLGLLEEDGEPAHYMGYLVLQSSDNKYFDIIDGQQRLTTISILILASLSRLQTLVKDNIDAHKNQLRKDNLQNSYIGYVDPVTLVSRAKLELNRHNNRFYKTYLTPLANIPQRGLNASEHQLRKAFYWLESKLKNQCQTSGESIAFFIDTMADKLFFTVITVTDELNAFKVFETLNSRGVRLSATDLLKNYLFSIIASGDSHETEIETLENLWERILEELGSESFPEFLRIYWNSSHKLVRKTELFKTIRRQINNKKKAFELLRILDISASIYAALRNPFDSFWHPEEQQLLNQLAMFNVRQPLGILMATYQKFGEEKRDTFTKILKCIAVISFRYNVICNFSTPEQEKIYNTVAEKISDNLLVNERDIIEGLNPIYPNDNTFKNNFREKELKTSNSRNRKVLRYILLELEKQISGKEFDLESTGYNIEHILPENTGEEWSFIEENNQDKYIYRLGNLTLLETKVNRDLGNQSYSKKIEMYKNSDFQLTNSIPKHYPRWNESTIVSRQSQMAKQATSIWRF
ncbi:DUF262 domain-containing protein [Geminocystis sp. CENA526]|uniref:DUF262 domain-containing protein n=1 Tax=Geminocystis sp. CENA526 TaxID=1355871 RepID=UPI003D6EF026